MNWQQKMNYSDRFAIGVKATAEAELLTVLMSGFAVNICLSGVKNLFCLNSISPTRKLPYVSDDLWWMIGQFIKVKCIPIALDKFLVPFTRPIWI